METKEKYIKPGIEVIEVEFENVIAASFDLNEEEGVVNPRSKPSFWGED